MLIPNKFNCAGMSIKVTVEDKLLGNEYGTWSDVNNEIKLARTVEVEGTNVTLTEQQIINTFWHEVMHCFQFYFNNGCDETQAQVFANFMCEFINSTNEEDSEEGYFDNAMS